MFYWGAATSAHQVEGNTHNDWSEWEKQTAKDKAAVARQKTWPAYILDKYPSPLDEENYISGRACEHYHRFREDFDIAKSLGHNAHRFSIEWSRIEPEEGKFNEEAIEHYRQVIAALRERGLEPFVTLWHFTSPIWFMEQSGFLNPKCADHFSKYVEYVVSNLKDVKFWITFNEADDVYAAMAYFRGVWPPNIKSSRSSLEIISGIIHSHKVAYQKIKEISPKSLVGIVENNRHIIASGIFGGITQRILEYFRNRYVLSRVNSHLDFIGLNYYTIQRVSHGYKSLLKQKSSEFMSWEIYPEGMHHELIELKKFKKPIYITENGIADARDTQRADFIKGHLQAMKQAMNEGVDVRGYLHWSLLDNFEWAEGFWPRFGLVEVDYKTMERKIRPSAYEYKKIIENWPNL